MAQPQDSSITTQIKQLLGEAAWQQVFAPIEQASGLPNAAYWSPQWLALEQQRVFQRSWLFAGAAAEIANNGDIKPVNLAGVPLLLVRDQTSQIRAFHNVCRHRGAK